MVEVEVVALLHQTQKELVELAEVVLVHVVRLMELQARLTLVVEVEVDLMFLHKMVELAVQE
tara:strand:+ start:455 stop:640 length:186 start_codon:yes stop_codon:yes gene_type:complete